MALRRARATVVELHGMTCYLCHNGIPSWVEPLHPSALTIDHVVPLKLGGTEDLDNLRPAHRRCNLKKGSRLLVAA
jgi:5-methylcytosine-specific restriction endonuclease McrA